MCSYEGGSIKQSDMAAALAEINKIDPNFDKEAFVKECQFEIIPTVLEAYLRGNLPVLKDWCHEAVSSCVDKEQVEKNLHSLLASLLHRHSMCYQP